MALPFEVSGRSDNGNWVSGGLHNLSGPGLPSTSVSHGASQAVGNLLAGPGLPGGDMSISQGHNSGIDQIANPRISIHTQYMVDTNLTNVNYDMGDMELVFINKESGDDSLSGQHKPHEFKSLHAMNRFLSLPESRRRWGHEKDTVWFNKIFAFAGVVRHLDAKDRLHLEMGDLCQLIVTGGKVMIYDVFLSCKNKSSPTGAGIGDLLQLVLLKVTVESEIEKALPSDDTKQRQDLRHHYAWKLIPYYDKQNCEMSPHLLYDRETKTRGQAFNVGRVSAIYGGADQPALACALARKIMNTPSSDASYQVDLYKLRRIEIEVTVT